MRLSDTIHRRLPLHLAFAAAFVLLLALSGATVGADTGRLFGNLDRAGNVIGRMLSPDWSFLPSVLPALRETVQMAIAGTALGTALALPVSFLATTTVSGSRVVTSAVRAVLNIIRTIPDVLVASLLVALVSIGPFTGMLAITVFTFGFISKLFYEAIDTIHHGPVESLASVGATRPQIAVHAVLPQIMPNVVSYTLYVLEINVRASIVLGMVGAGGVGVPLQSAMGLTRYDRVAVIVIAVFAVVLVIDAVSAWARRRML
ncbi:phosphonate ABC transporter, permease protein PhnE [Microbacterium album]|uniref:Phosphonate ABC transporter, permease protein PhnE n=1 Tax=Microbacterium album TaxID=2053191 RepID=A0A917IC59_9MICO|nr:phosphonate ABC transporter, permease protein PhnE [Microbacterium album]GGH34451.1 phosphonate ABC transporter, permease protein PhnE [Microbacterium album]